MKKIAGAILILFSAFANGQNVLESGIGKLNLIGCGINGGSIEITGNGNILQRKAYLNAETVLEEIDQNYDVKIVSLDTNGTFRFGIGKQASLAGTFVEFSGNDSTSKVIVNRMDNTSVIFIKEYPLPFKISLGQTYQVRVAKRVRTLIVEITGDTVHYINDSLSYPSPFFGCLWGTPFIACRNGKIAISDFSLSTPFSLNPRLAVWGDSFIEGNALTDANDRYISLVKDSIGNQNIAIMGRGGESSSSLNSRFPKESQWFNKSKYALLAVGVNDNNFSSWKSTILSDISKLKQFNIVPIIVTLSPRADRLSFIKQVNAWIRNDYNGAYVDLSKAIAISDTVWASGMNASDNIHITPAGHKLIFKRIAQEAPYIFRDFNAFTIDYISETTFENIGDSLQYSSNSNFLSATYGTSMKIPVTPGIDIYFQDTITRGVKSLFDILLVPPRPNVPTNPIVNASTATFDWTNNPYYTAVSDYEYSVDNGANWITCNQKPINSPGTSLLQLRVKATTKNFKSDLLYFDITTGIVANNNFNNIRVFPNPISDKLIIENIDESTQLTIYSNDGRIVKSFFLENTINSINTEELSTGFYIVTLSNKTWNRNFKILKN